MKRLILVFLLIPIIAYTQGSGTPSTLRVKTDSNGALVVSNASQVPPYTTSTFNNTILKTDSNGNLVVAGAGGGDSNTVYNVNSYDIACNSIDASSDFLDLLDIVSDAGGGTIYFPACEPGEEYRFDSQLLIPNDGATPQPNQVNIRLTGAGGGPQWYNRNAVVLDLRYTAVDGNAKIETRGLGTLQIDSLTLQDLGASNATPFIHSTNTTLDIHENTFIGSGNVGQDAIVLGGPTTDIDGSLTAAFQGYGTSIRDNHFRNMNRGLYGLTYANAVVFTENSFQANVGTIGVEFDGSAGGVNTAHGNVISNNLFEMDVYTYGIKLTSAQYNTFVGNQFFDPDGSVTSYFNFNATATQNTIVCGYQPVSRPFVSGTAASIEGNTYLCTNAAASDSKGKGTQSNELAYGLIVKGTYDITKAYPGQLTVSSQNSPNFNLGLGVDTVLNAGVISSYNNVTAIPTYIRNTLHVGRNGTDTTVNLTIDRGTAQVGNLFTVQHGSGSEATYINAGGTIVGEVNAGIKYQLVSAVPSIRLSSDAPLLFNSSTNLGGGSLDASLARISAGQLAFGNNGSRTYTVNANSTPSCTSNCGTSPTVTGVNSSFTVTMGSSGAPASGFVITFGTNFAAAPQCVASMGKAGMVVGKLPLTVVTTTSTVTVVTNGTAPATEDVYHFICSSGQ